MHSLLSRLVEQPGVFFFHLLFFAITAGSPDGRAGDVDVSALLAKAHQAGLAHDPQWLSLLQYDKDGGKSEVLTADFFLDAKGQTDPEAELVATIQAVFASNAGEPSDQHARCRYPARHYWIAKRLGLDGFNIREARCTRLERWARFDHVRSLSVLLVSGYFGNPASSFGHSLLRLNADNADESSNLLDLTFNFGALVPANELIPVYVYRGLTGGYQSGFSDKYFYSEDMVYSKTEFRDIWSYELALDDEELRFMVYHLWEIVGKKFTYYFLSENCAYRMAEMIELVKGEHFLDRSAYWYTPIELFVRLHELDRRQPGKFIRSVRFSPSAQRVLHAQFDALKTEERGVANQLIQNDSLSLDEALVGAPEQARINLTEALLAYYQFKIVGEQPRPSEVLRKKKDSVLLERLRLPPQERAADRLPALDSPASRSGPMLAAGGLGWSDTDKQVTAHLEWSAYHQGPLDENGLSNGELAVADLVIRFEVNRARLQKLDFIRVRKFNDQAVTIHGESDWSWQARVGLQRPPGETEPNTELLFSFGVGNPIFLSCPLQ